MKRQHQSNLITFDYLCKLLDVKTIDEHFDGPFESSNANYAYSQAIKEGETEEKAEEISNEIQMDEESEAWRKYRDAVESVAEQAFSEHGLTLLQLEGKPHHGWAYRIVLITSRNPDITNDWSKVADHIRHTINGVGYFGFDSLKEFLDSGPYTPRQAVFSHLHWIKDWFAVYEGGTAKSSLDSKLRY
jgi:hypothetical protein